MDICLTNNHLPNFSFISLIYDLKVKQMSNYISKTKSDKYLET